MVGVFSTPGSLFPYPCHALAPPPLPPFQAFAVWRWSNYLHDQCACRGKQPLLINLDETSVPVVFAHVKGNFMVHNGRRAWRPPPRQASGKNEQRTFFTHVGLICNDPAIQPLLPQVIFVGSPGINWAEWSLLVADLPPNVFIKRMPRGWNNADQHKLIIRILGLVLRPFLATRQPILSFDAAKLHLNAEVLHEIYTAHMWYLLIPARLTWLLQPLDTHAFLKYKRYLKSLFLDTFGTFAFENRTSRMARLVIEAIRHVLQGNEWHAAFDTNGLGGSLCNVSKYIKDQLHLKDLPALPRTRPSIDEVRVTFPRNVAFNYFVVFEPFPTPVVAAPPLLAVEAAPAAAMEASGLPVSLLTSRIPVGPIENLRCCSVKRRPD